ncbi:uncharacterized protein LOC127834402 [Dreissena polymorpha]|uniref:Uncharacterized protein n=1 Tax=Dreissena polymorpha TaxID=45954 RepID=A0A9D4RY50_DREPO|nr:uncharacterized protein LOC127834402 [Dreissena polymorpha]KAH3883305.1 hypothetical protein DPMN_007259 [Dreissena polymorpha]
MFGDFRRSHAHGHEANELESFMDSLRERRLETIKYFTHMTTTENIRKIFKDGTMFPRNTETPHWSVLSRDKDAPMGVWFSASLYHGELPETSAFGDNRIKIPCQFIVQNMFQPRLFLEAFYYYESNPKNQIVRLILVDAEVHRREAEWCEKKCLRRLNMVDNKILVLNRNKKVYQCVKNDGELFPYIWVEVLVVGQVDMVAIDTIDETTPSKLEPTPGKVPTGV